jgi:hypothetical protein
MRLESYARRSPRRWSGAALVGSLALAASGAFSIAFAQGTDPRVGLKPGIADAGVAARNLELVAHVDRSQGFFDPADPGSFSYANSDLAFKGNLLFQGSFNGFQIWDISDPAKPTIKTAFACPGGQGDPSVYGNLLFISVEMPNGRVDCGAQGVQDTVSTERFRGVRIFDLSDVDHPKQVAAVQTCRGSHTHTLVTDPKDRKNVYVYVSGTSFVRSPNELAGCSGKSPAEDPNTSLFRIEIIQVPLDRPEDAKIVAAPRLFADLKTGNIAGLWKGGAHGEGTQETSQTNQCHDITVYPALGLAAGACSGNGILLDISDPVHPKRIDEVMDPNFAYWHSATFSNDGKKVVFTDEWGGGTQPRCRATDKPTWGADAFFTLAGRKLHPEGHFKLPAAQTPQENCVAHNGSLIPVPGRDLFVQAWYQGGISVIDFTDPAHPKEIAFFDRGPLDAEKLVLGGFWSAYWYDGHIYGSEIARGLDVFRLVPSDALSENEIEAARLVKLDVLNAQMQPKFEWPASFVVARAYLDQLGRSGGLSSARLASVKNDLASAEQASLAARRTALGRLASQLDGDARGSKDAARVRALASTVRGLAAGR